MKLKGMTLDRKSKEYTKCDNIEAHNAYWLYCIKLLLYVQVDTAAVKLEHLLG